MSSTSSSITSAISLSKSSLTNSPFVPIPTKYTVILL